MTPDEALNRAKTFAFQDRIRFTFHGKVEARNASASPGDVQQAIQTATLAKYDTSKKTWRIEGGRDLDGDDLTVVLVLEDDHGRLVTTF
jgi:hypothetical protein